MRIFLSAGEASGDAYGAALVDEIRRLSGADRKSMSDLLGRQVCDESTLNQLREEDSLDVVEYVMRADDEFAADIPNEAVGQPKKDPDPSPILYEGIGGSKMRAAGVAMFADSSSWGAISIAQAAKVFIRIYYHFRRAKKRLRQGQPGLFIPIDFGFANIRMAKFAKRQGWKVLYFIPPGSWRRDRQGKDLPELADEIVTPFSWSAEMLQKMGAHVHWYGHPVKQLIRDHKAKTDSAKPHRRTLAVLPGSRKHELELNLPVIAAAVGGPQSGIAASDNPERVHPVSRSEFGNLDAPIEFGLAPSIDLDKFRTEWQRLAPGRTDTFTAGDTYGVLKRATAAVVCSGTATLEAALNHCPMAVIYQVSESMRREAKLIRLKRPRYISLPNIMLEREVVPELVDSTDASIPALRHWIDLLLSDEATRRAQLSAFKELDDALGPDNAITRTAELAIAMISRA
ncbi:MAG: hypothetical protein IT203_06715 [Fimbriimonadaceae bacterium]|nr:hypothetical protein [Fimbriimonadaceae bacterium]